jgi:hypothetical protein
MATFIIRDAGATASFATSTTPVNDDDWHYIVGVRDVSADKIRIYVDGVLEEEVVDDTTLNIQNGNDLAIGSNSMAAVELWLGLIDEARLYNRALPIAEIRQIYDSGRRGHAGSIPSLSKGVAIIT